MAQESVAPVTDSLSLIVLSFVLPFRSPAAGVAWAVGAHIIPDFSHVGITCLSTSRAECVLRVLQGFAGDV